jgi:hypothetical protein
VPIEVKTSRARGAAAALSRFSQTFGTQPGIVVGPGGVALEDFLSEPASVWC